MVPPVMHDAAPKFVALSEENLRPRQIPAHRANHWVLTEPGWKVTAGQNGKPWACGITIALPDRASHP